MEETENRVEIDSTLESVLRYCLEDAKKRMLKGEQVVPFSALVAGESLFIEEHPADEPAQSFASAQKTVAGARGAKAYGFCYDGFITIDTPTETNVQRDCLIAEGGTPGAEYGHAIGLLYTSNDKGDITFEEEPVYIAQALNYMVNLKDLEEEEADAEEANNEAEAEEADTTEIAQDQDLDQDQDAQSEED